MTQKITQDMLADSAVQQNHLGSGVGVGFKTVLVFKRNECLRNGAVDAAIVPTSGVYVWSPENETCLVEVVGASGSSDGTYASGHGGYALQQMTGLAASLMIGVGAAGSAGNGGTTSVSGGPSATGGTRAEGSNGTNGQGSGGQLNTDNPGPWGDFGFGRSVKAAGDGEAGAVIIRF